MGFWNDRTNRRQFLIDLAKSKGLDPLSVYTWKNITQNDVITAKVNDFYTDNAYSSVRIAREVGC
jgi:hypothetical protein